MFETLEIGSFHADLGSSDQSPDEEDEVGESNSQKRPFELTDVKEESTNARDKEGYCSLQNG